MKLLPCRQCERHDPKTPWAELRDGTPYVIGRAPSTIHGKSGFSYRCSRCKRATILRSDEYARLPEMTLADLERMGMSGLFETDMLGAGLTREQLDEVVAAGVTAGEVTEMQPMQVSRPEEVFEEDDP